MQMEKQKFVPLRGFTYLLNTGADRCSKNAPKNSKHFCFGNKHAAKKKIALLPGCNFSTPGRIATPKTLPK